MERQTLVLPLQSQETDRPVVLTRALAQCRVNNQIKYQNLWLRKTRVKYVPSLGDYYLLDRTTNTIVRSFVNLENYAREISAIAPYEAIEG